MASGISTAGLILLVPPVLARHLSQAEFSAWMLILQLASYTSILNLGIQSATSRYVAYYFARNERASASDIVSTAFVTLMFMAFVACCIVILASENIGLLFPAMPSSLVGNSKTSLLLMGLTLALGLPVDAIAGTFIGIQRNELVALIQGGCRLILAAALIWIALDRGGLASMAAAFSAINVASYFTYWWTNRRLDIVNISFHRARWSSFSRIWEYCGTLIVWSAAMFFINGFDVAILGRLDFPAAGVYSVCFGPILLIAGVQHALFSPLLQFAAALSSRSAEKSLPAILLRSTKLSTLLLLSVSIPLLLFSRSLLGWWLGPKFTDQALTIFALLLVGNTVRLFATPYALLLLATLKHNRVILAPIVEAVSNVVVAIAAGLRFGAVGVALGVVAGAFIGQLMIVYVNAPRTMELIGNLRVLMWRGIAQPVACALPALAVALTDNGRTSKVTGTMMNAAALLVCGALAWRFSIGTEEKSIIVGAISRIRRGLARRP